jgi:hypothetical protein
MLKKHFFLAVIPFVLVLAFNAESGNILAPPIPARIGGTVTIDGVLLTQDTDDGYTFKVTKQNGTDYLDFNNNPAEDSDGLNSSDWYVIDIPIYDATDQLGGANPGETAILHVFKDGSELTVTSSPNGEFIVGNSGSTTQIDLEAISNQPPTADAGPDQTVYEGMTVILNGSNSSDQDGTIAAYQWTQTAGTSVTLDDTTAAQPTFTAPNVGVGGESLTFELAVADNGGLENVDTCIVNVTFDNQPPTADAGTDQTVDEGDTVTLDGSNSSDPDPGDSIASYLWTQAAGTLVTLSDATAVQPTFISPQVGPDGESFTFHLTVVDNGGLQATDTCIVNVTWENNPPIANAGPDQTVYEEFIVILNGFNSYDQDGTIATYQWTQTAGTSVTLDDPTAAQPTFTAPDAETSLTFQLTVTDDGGLQGTDTCVVTVNAVPTDEDEEEDDVGVCFITTAAFGSLLE